MSGTMAPRCVPTKWSDGWRDDPDRILQRTQYVKRKAELIR